MNTHLYEPPHTYTHNRLLVPNRLLQDNINRGSSMSVVWFNRIVWTTINNCPLRKTNGIEYYCGNLCLEVYIHSLARKWVYFCFMDFIHDIIDFSWRDFTVSLGNYTLYPYQL